MPWTSLSDIWVLPECLWAGSSVTVTTESVPWSVFVRYSKPVAVPRKQQSQQQMHQQQVQQQHVSNHLYINAVLTAEALPFVHCDQNRVFDSYD